MHAQRPQRVPRGLHRGEGSLHPEIPEFDFSIAAARDQFPESPPLHVHVGDPLLVFAPDFDHGGCGSEPLVEDSDCPVAESGHKYVPRDLVRGQGCDTRS